MNEIAFKAEQPGSADAQSQSADLEFMANVLALIEDKGVPAPAPIEQRWTAASSALMSPAHSDSGQCPIL